ncbi:MAG: 30S ribosomal protein S16 [Candidatus Omnitrophica bacterium]|nr:30S ribosomal protein S16 [Candidatus Omnitrophota bacterium]
MAVKIRLRRIGKRPKKLPFFRITVADAHASRDGKFIEEIGYYDPTEDPPRIKIDTARYEYWLKKGAQPTETVAHLYEKYKKIGGKNAE